MKRLVVFIFAALLSVNALAANYGNTANGTSGTSGLEMVSRLIPITVSGSEDAVSVAAWLSDSAPSAGRFAKGLLYDGSGNFVAETATANSISATPTLYTMNFSASFPISAGNYYVGIVASFEGGSQIRISYNDAADGSGYRDVTWSSFATPPNPATLQSQEQAYSIYLITSASSSNAPRAMHYKRVMH